MKIKTTFTSLFGVIIISLLLLSMLFLALLSNRKAFGKMQISRHKSIIVKNEMEDGSREMHQLLLHYITSENVKYLNEYNTLKTSIQHINLDNLELEQEEQNKINQTLKLLKEQVKKEEHILQQYQENNQDAALHYFYQESYEQLIKTIHVELDQFESDMIQKTQSVWELNRAEGFQYFYSSLTFLLFILVFSCISFYLIRKRLQRQEVIDFRFKESVEDLKKVKQELEKSDERFTLAVEGTGLLIWDFDTKNKTINWFPKGCCLFDYPYEEIIPTLDFLREHIHKDDLEILQKQIEHHKATRDKIYFDARFYTKDKTLRWYRCHGAPVYQQGELARIVGTFNDITEQLHQDEKIVDAILETEDKERSRIAREIHDNLQQTMSTAILNLEKVRAETVITNEEEKKHFNIAYSYLKKAIQESRTLAHNLMPKVVSANGLVSAIQALISALQGTTSTEIHFYENLGEERVKLSVEMTLYRIVQESINNMIKHAEASQCTIQLLKHPDMIVLTIEDDGVGFDLNTKVDSFGLNSMKTRANAVGAYFQISSQKTKGTEIIFELGI
ncbi:PAS domain-containing sensor histidine kinase [Flammeovirga aprica]|uniref:histidine kinase n=1 Tax=Flammeovirga aprica JL-4 TaxID=694437 RepID=A0A7X9P4A1_9BACT|nr:PAS domain-containing protein [Flammeovirga aprica]NME68682.1 PAS domain-containing protein [Flammeovirga aprica JL-4]